MTRDRVQVVQVRDAEIRVFNQDPGPESDDASDMYVLEVFGLSLLVRLRRGDLTEPGGLDTPYVHIDNEGGPHGPLFIEVCNAGETEYRV